MALSFADQLNRNIETGGGGTWVKLRDRGASVAGELLGIEERDKMFNGAPVLSQRSGKPRTEWVITLRVDTPDPSIEDDDCVRKVAATETLQWAITDHMRDTGQRFTSSWGGRLAIVVVNGATGPTASMEKADFQVKYVAPSGPSPAAINAAVDQPSTPSVDDLI